MNIEDVELPNGAVLQDVPVGTSDDEVAKEAIRLGLAAEGDFHGVRSAQADIQPNPLEGMDYLSGAAGQVAHGTFASWGDEIAAGIATGISHGADAIGIPTDLPEGDSVRDTYMAIRNSIRDRNEQFRTENPKTSVGLNVAGAMLPLGHVTKGAKTAVGGTGTLMAAGGGFSMLDYLGELQQFEDFEVLEAMKRTGLGAAIPGILAGGKGAWHWLKNREKDEVAAVLDELKRHTGKSGDDLVRQADNLGPDASLVDATGDVGVGYAQGVRGVGAMDVMQTIDKNISPKLAKAKDRIRSVLKSITGKGENEYHDTLDGLVTARKTRANELYGKALDEGVVEPTEKMVAIMNQNPSVRDAYQRVADNYARSGHQVPKVFEVDELTGKIVKRFRGGEDVSREVPNMRFLQEMKFEMDKMTGAMRGSTDSAGKVAYGRLMDDKHEFLEEVYKQNPAFKAANEAFSGDIALESAMQMGKKHGLGKGNVDDQLNTISKLTQSEKSAYLQGVMSDVYNTLGRSRDDVMGNVNQITSRNAQKVLKKLVGKEGTRKVMKEFRAQRRFFEVNQKVRQGSETASRQAAAESLNKRLSEVNVEDIQKTAGELASKASLLGKAIRAVVPDKFGKMGTEQLDELADLMTKPGGTRDAVERMKNAGFNEFEISDTLRYFALEMGVLPAATGPQEFEPTPVPMGLMQ